MVFHPSNTRYTPLFPHDVFQLHAQEFLSMIIADRMSESLVVLATDLNW